MREVEPSATRAPSSSSSGTCETITQDITGPSQPTAMSGKATRSSAFAQELHQGDGPDVEVAAHERSLSFSGVSFVSSRSRRVPVRASPQ